MNVLYIASSIPSTGIHYYSALMAIELKKQGVNIKIVSSPGEADFGVRAMVKQAGLKIIDFPFSERRGIYSTLQSAKWISRYCSENKIDIIYSGGFASTWRCLLGRWLFNQKCQIPIVVTLHSIRHGQRLEMLARFISSQIFNFTACSVCVISSIEAKKMQQVGLNPKKINLIPNIVDVTRFEKNYVGQGKYDLPFEDKLNDRIVFTYLAVLIPRKGHKFLLDAMKIIISYHKNAFLVIAGEGPLKQSLKSQVNKIGINDNVLFVGKLTPGQVPCLLDKTTIGVVASLSETFGYAIIEPLLAGKPVVTTNVGIAQDLAKANGVLMVPTRDSRALAGAILEYINNPTAAKDDARRGKEYVLSNCNLEIVAQRYKSVYEKCQI